MKKLGPVVLDQHHGRTHAAYAGRHRYAGAEQRRQRDRAGAAGAGRHRPAALVQPPLVLMTARSA